MSPLKTVLKFGAACLLFFALLDIAWLMFPSVRGGYAAVYRATGNVLFCKVGQGRVRFYRQEGGLDTATEFSKVGVRSTVPGPESSSLIQGYLPTSIVAAMVLASPVSWRRRLIALLTAFLVIQGFVAARIGLMVFEWFGRPSPIRVFESGEIEQKVLFTAREALWSSPQFSIVAPVIVWALVTIRMEDVRRVLDGIKSESGNVAAITGRASKP